MFHIRIKPWEDPKKGLWHFYGDLDGKKGESVIPKDWFKRMMDDIHALVLSIEIFDDSIASLREAVEKKDIKTIQGLVQNMIGMNTVKGKRRGNDIIRKSATFTNYLNSSVETMKKQQNSTDVIQNIAMALSLIKEDFKEIDEKISTKKIYEKHIPTSNFPNLTEMQASKTAQWQQTIESFASIAGVVGKAFLG